MRHAIPSKRRHLIFRVFFSSTFLDLIDERNALQETVFRELRMYCQERGARFQAIDLRWGVSQEAALDQQTMNICFQELARCQEMSPRPNFIILLGERYGWRPLPSQVPADEFEALLSQVTAEKRPLLFTGMGVDSWRDCKTLFRKGWYRKDLNAVPPEYVLQSRTIDFPANVLDDDRQRISREEAQDWYRIEQEIRGLIMGAIRALGWSKEDPRRAKYEHSATHQEIEHGALHPGLDAERHVFAYFRHITSAIEETAISNCVDTGEDKNQLDMLKAQLRSQLPESHIHEYQAVWKGDYPESDLKTLCNRVRDDLKTIIDAELRDYRRCPELEREIEAHHQFAVERCRYFVGRLDVLDRIRAYLDDPEDRHTLVVHGLSGSGKTAVMAQAWLTLTNPTCTVSRFIGTTPESADLRSLLRGLCIQLGITSPPMDMNELIRVFRRRLSDPEKSENELLPPRDVTIIFLDALDQLNPTDNARLLDWIPSKLAPTVKVVVSVLGNEKATLKPTPEIPAIAAHQSRDELFEIARRNWPTSLVEVGPLDATSAAQLFDSWLNEASRTVEANQRNEVLDKFSRCPLPLYLKLAVEQASRWKSWEGVPEPLADTVEGLLKQLLVWLERPENHGRTLVGKSLGYLAAGKNGLTEEELLDLLSRETILYGNFVRGCQHLPSDLRSDLLERMVSETHVTQSDINEAQLFNWFDTFRRDEAQLYLFLEPILSKKNGPKLPVIIWAQLFAKLAPYMTQRRADGTIVMDFYHRQVGEAVRKRYLSSDEALVQTHLQMAEYFDTLDFWAESLEMQLVRAKRLPPTPRPVNLRKVTALPYHRLEVAKLAGKNDPISLYWDIVANLLTNWQFLEAKAEANPNFLEQVFLEPTSNNPEEKP
jgi:hypothetical protein